MALLPSTCPVDYATKDWVEDSMHLLGSVFGRKRLREAPVVEPTGDYFPDEFAASIEGAKMLLSMTATFVGTDVDGIEVRIVPQRDEIWLVENRDFDNAPSAPQPPANVIEFTIELDDLSKPEQLVGLFARELSALRLVEDGGINTDAYDFGPLADLTAVYLGLGVFNAALPYPAVETDEGGGRMTPFTLPPLSLGYALAHVAWHRGEEKPSWLKFLPPDVKACVKQGIRYLVKTGESDFAPR